MNLSRTNIYITLALSSGIFIGLVIASVATGVMSSILAAIIAVCGAVVTGYVSNFVAEDYRRFRDGSSLAAALAGELSSHSKALPDLTRFLNSLKDAAEKGLPAPLRPFDRPNDPVFEAGVAKLGLLEPEVVEDVVFVYQQVRAFRTTIGLLFGHYDEMSKGERVSRCNACLKVIEAGRERGAALLTALRARAKQEYRFKMPWPSTAIESVNEVKVSGEIN